MKPDFNDFDTAILTVEGCTVANHMLRELMEAMGESLHARPETPQAVWDQMLAQIRRGSTQP